MDTILNYINGKWEAAGGCAFMDVENPSYGTAIARMPLSGKREADRAAGAALAAFDSWRQVPVAARSSYLYKLREAMSEHSDELASVISMECGKSLTDSRAEMKRAIQNVEVACGMPMLMKGEKLNGAANGIDVETIRHPIGVFAVICPYNFPAMVPFWFLPYAIASGNTLIVKPSEQVPLTMKKIFELIDGIGLPAGVINMVNGGKEVAEALVAGPDISGVSFVGSSEVARKVSAECAKLKKRCQALGSAKNHIIVMEDADIKKTVDSLLTSCFGCAGQRCMAASVVAAVPEVYDRLLKSFAAEAKKLKVGDANDENTDVGPLISEKARQRVLSYIEKGIAEGAGLVLDGRCTKLPGELENGYFIGPTIFKDTSAEMSIMKDEIFGPVICVAKINSLDEGLKLINESKYGNGASIFTQNGSYARKFEMEAGAGMIGINIGIPAPVAYMPFGGTKQSIFADIKAQGTDVIDFYTEKKIVTLRYF